jgi:DNA polymerase III gamma/tau subunit
LMVIKIGGKALGKLIDYPVAQKDLLLAQSQKLSLQEILKTIELLIEAQDVARITETNRMPLELAFAKITYQSGAVAAPKPSAPTAGVSPKPAVQPKPQPTVKPPVAATMVERLKDNKGELLIAADEPREQPAEPQMELSSDDEPTIETIRNAWNALTHEVSRHKMSLATYMQDGSPYSYKDGKLVIGFSPDHVFQKEVLEHRDNLKVVMNIFSEKLRRSVVVQAKIIEDMNAPASDPTVDQAVNLFKGKVVKQWHNE